MTALGQVREDTSTITAKLSKAHNLDVSPVLALIGYPCDRGDNSGSEFMVRFPFALSGVLRTDSPADMRC